jgi:hypothetical protein
MLIQGLARLRLNSTCWKVILVQPEYFAEWLVLMNMSTQLLVTVNWRPYCRFNTDSNIKFTERPQSREVYTFVEMKLTSISPTRD